MAAYAEYLLPIRRHTQIADRTVVHCRSQRKDLSVFTNKARNLKWRQKMAKNNYEFDFQPASWLPSRDVEMLDRVRNIKREDMEYVLIRPFVHSKSIYISTAYIVSVNHFRNCGIHARPLVWKNHG